MNARVARKAIFSIGLLMPLALFVMHDFALAEMSRGKGGFEAPFPAMTGLFIVPGLLVANCWLFVLQWGSHWRVFLARVRDGVPGRNHLERSAP